VLQEIEYTLPMGSPQNFYPFFIYASGDSPHPRLERYKTDCSRHVSLRR